MTEIAKVRPRDNVDGLKLWIRTLHPLRAQRVVALARLDGNKLETYGPSLNTFIKYGTWWEPLLEISEWEFDFFYRRWEFPPIDIATWDWSKYPVGSVWYAKFSSGEQLYKVRAHGKAAILLEARGQQRGLYGLPYNYQGLLEPREEGLWLRAALR